MSVVPICVASRIRCASPPDRLIERPVERQVVQADVHEEPEPRDDLLEHLAGDRPLALGDAVARARSPSRAPR